MKANLVAAVLALTGLGATLGGLSVYRHPEINATVKPDNRGGVSAVNIKTYPLKLVGSNVTVPQFDSATTKVDSVKPGVYPVLESSFGIGLLLAALGLYDARTRRLKKDFPDFVADTQENLENALYRREIQQQAYAATSIYNRQAHLGEVAESQIEIDQREHDLTLLQLTRQQEIKTQQLALAEIDRKLKEASKAPKELSTRERWLKQLKEHEGGWLLELLTGSKPLFLVGVAGSGKTTTAASLMLLRHYLHGQEISFIGDPHGHKNAPKIWNKLLKVSPTTKFTGSNLVDSGDDWESYERDFYKQEEIFDKTPPMAENDDSNKVVASQFWDEATRIRGNANGDTAKLNRFKKGFVGMFTSPRKAMVWVVFGVHFFTNEVLPDGMYELVRNGANRLELTTDSSNKPTLQGKYITRGGYGEDIVKLVTLPKWLLPETIIKEFSETV